MLCSICLDDLNNISNVIQMPNCDHKFHSKCFCSYMEIQLPKEIVCPLCRKEVVKMKEPLSILIVSPEDVPHEVVDDKKKLYIITSLYLLCAFSVTLGYYYLNESS